MKEIVILAEKINHKDEKYNECIMSFVGLTARQDAEEFLKQFPNPDIFQIVEIDP